MGIYQRGTTREESTSLGLSEANINLEIFPPMFLRTIFLQV